MEKRAFIDVIHLQNIAKTTPVKGIVRGPGARPHRQHGSDRFGPPCSGTGEPVRKVPGCPRPFFGSRRTGEKLGKSLQDRRSLHLSGHFAVLARHRAYSE
ncbi:hypothetical protein GCM10007148_03740 [Parvularcula lutaonensis]|nr:hypothetical protein GCM10007148_03740 [Parvularcula lutaonensis]